MEWQAKPRRIGEREVFNPPNYMVAVKKGQTTPQISYFIGAVGRGEKKVTTEREGWREGF